MNGYIIGPMTFHQAEALLAQLIYRSDSFHSGCNPVVGRLKSSYGYQRIIGISSFDNKVYTRIDYDDEKGFHYHFIDDHNGDNICILIQDMDKKQYQRYIDRLTIGRNIGKRKKRKIKRNEELAEEIVQMLEEGIEPPPSIYYDLFPLDKVVEQKELAPQKKKRH